MLTHKSIQKCVVNVKDLRLSFQVYCH